MAFRHRVWTSIVDFQLLVLLLVRPHLRAVASVLWLKVLWLKVPEGVRTCLCIFRRRVAPLAEVVVFADPEERECWKRRC